MTDEGATAQQLFINYQEQSSAMRTVPTNQIIVQVRAMGDYDFERELMRDNYQLMSQNRQLMAENCELKQANQELLADNLWLNREYHALLEKGQVVKHPHPSDNPLEFNQVFDSEDVATIEQLIRDFPAPEEDFPNLSGHYLSNPNNAPGAC